MPVNMSMYGPHGSYANQNQMMMSQQQAQLQNQNPPSQQHHYNQMYRTPYPGPGPGPGYIGPRPDMGSRQDIGYSSIGPRFQNPNYNQRNQFPVTQVQGSVGTSQSSVQQAHPHLRRNNGQTPQEVANNILQIASSTYPSHHTVQVPLSKNRPAPYQIPSKSPHYNMQQKQAAEQYTAQVCQPPDYPSNKHFGYPNTSPHMMQHNRMSPVSPSPGMIQSPHSHQSSQSLPNSSPHSSIHSPVPGGIKSPGSDGSAVRSPIVNLQPMASPQGVSYQQMTSQHQHMNSPVPINQQLQVSVPSSSSSHRICSMYGDNVISPTNQAHHPQNLHSSHFSPSGNSMISPGRFSNISSPYTPGSKTSHHSPDRSYSVTSTTSQYLTDIGPPIDAAGQEESSGGSNPLRSLQKLCMLPERQVVDPKSVVNDACLPSPQSIDNTKNYDSHTGSRIKGNTQVSEPVSFVASPNCTDGSNCSPKLEDTKPGSSTNTNIYDSCLTNTSTDKKDSLDIDKQVNSTDICKSKDYDHSESNKNNTICEFQKVDKNNVENSVNNCLSVLKNANEIHGNNDFEEVKCQPKKVMLLRAAQDDANKQKQELKDDEVIYKQSLETKLPKNDEVSDNQSLETKPSKTDEISDKQSPLETKPSNSGFSNKQPLETKPSENDKVSNKQSTEAKSDLKTESCENNSVEKHLNEDESGAEKCVNEDESGGSGSVTDAPDTHDIENKIEVSESDQKQTVVAGAIAENPISDIETDESELVVRKDTVNTYGRKDKLTATITKDLPARIRSQSTGSFSDDFDNSDFDYEDHIGCDDLDNNPTSDDSMEKENIMDLDNTVLKTDTDTVVNEIKSAIITENGCKVKLPSSPHWKKSKLNDLQALQHDSNQNVGDKICDVGSKSINCKKKARVSSRGRKIRKTFNCGMELNGHDSDSDGFYPNSFTEMGIDNGDGTLVLSKRVTTRERKQPLKYKDTSFIQGDFIFAEEEEEEDFDYEPKKKMKKSSNIISAHPDHETKRTDNIGKLQKSSKIPFNKNGLSKTQQTKPGNSVQKKIKSYSKSNVSDNPVQIEKGKTSKEIEHSCKDIQKNDNIHSTLEVEIEDKPPDNSASEKACDNDKKFAKGKDAKENNKTGTVEIAVSNLAKTEHTGSSSRRSQNQEKTSKDDCSGSKRKSESSNMCQTSRKSARLAKTNKKFTFGDTVDGLFSAKEEQDISVKVDGTSTITNVDEDRLNAAVNKSVKKEEKVENVEEVTLDLTCSDDELVNDTKSLQCGQDVMKYTVIENSKHKAVIKSDKQKQAKVKSTTKKQSNRKKKGKQKMNIYNNDSDYEAGPSCQSFKSLKLNKTQDLISKKKKHEKLGFKGPVIHLEGSKECPEKCAVVNQPFQEADIKANKTRTIVQNVSSVEISHLPSDKSILIPNSETEESDIWVCALCGKHSSYKFLGDLFGPYSVEVPMEGDRALSSKYSASSRGRTRSDDSVTGSGLSNRSAKTGQRINKETSMWKEVWVHESCSVWADGVFLIGTKIYGLQEAAKIANKTVGYSFFRFHSHLIAYVHAFHDILIQSYMYLMFFSMLDFPAGLGGSVGCAVGLETSRSRVQPPPRSATFFRGD